MNDLIELAIERAIERFGGQVNEGIFNAACFSAELCKLADVAGPIDGRIVRAILTGRVGIEVLHGGAHFRFLSVKP